MPDVKECLDMKKEQVIAFKVSNLADGKKSFLPNVFSALCGNKAGKMKYVDIIGVSLKGFEKKLIGTDEDLYISTLIDSISIVENMGIKDPDCTLCCNDSCNIAKLFGVHLVATATPEEIINKWVSEEYDVFEDGKDTDADWDEPVEEDYAEEETEEEPEEEEYEEYENDEELEEDEELTDVNEDEAVLREEIEKVFTSTVISLVGKVKKRYDLLFESGYDLERPYCIIGSEGSLYVDSENVLKLHEDPSKDIDFSALLNMYELFEGKIGFNESNARSSKVISQDLLEGYLSGGKLDYFPYKLIEYAFGRNPSREESHTYRYATYKGKGVSNNWGIFGNKIMEDVKLTIVDAIVSYCLNVLKTGYERENIRKMIRNSQTIKDIQSYIEYVADSLSVCVVITQYKSVDGKPVSMKMRVCDPRGKVTNGMTGEIINTAFSGNTGGSSGATLNSGLNESDSMTYRVFEFGHEFNHSLSNAMPLFAYKAFEKLREKGESVSFKDLILGQSTDGTILRNGTHGLVLDKKLFHYINAGSRSGKGVMTLNMIAGALLSGKAVIYLDNKPDMVSMLAKLCGGEEGGNYSGPPFFGINGSNNVDDKQKQFTHEDAWISRDNIPIEAVALFGEPTWSKYGEIFYMRAYTLAMGIILARGLDGGHGKMNDPAYGGKEGIFLVCDETNVLQEKFKVIGQIIADKIPLQAKKFKSMSASLESVYNEAYSENARKGAELKFFNAKRDFEEAFNAHKFYALAYLNTLSDNIAYIYDKSLAGFLQKEMECSDIVIIGQNLEQKPISKDTITSAVSSGRLSGEGSGANGLGGTQIAKDVKGMASIPFAHFVFSSSDALIGYNSLHPEYLAQTEQNSKAFGRLDLVANNFCYIPNFKVSASEDDVPGAQLTKNLANASTSVYFKPYLILNDASKAYTDQMFDRVRNAGLTPEDVIHEYPDDSGSNISPYVGFPEYMSLMGVSDIPERLKKGADIANMVVGSVLGYSDDGSGRPLWLQFVTDMRPEWMLSVRDIACMCGGLTFDANMTKGKDNPITKEYYEYIDYVAKHKELDINDNTMSCSEAYFEDDNGERQYDIGGYESDARRDFYATDDGSDEDFENEAFDERMAHSLGDDEVIENDEDIFDIFDDSDNFDEPGADTPGAFDDFVDDNEVGSKTMGMDIDEKDAIISALIAKLQENGIEVNDLEGYSFNANGKGVDCGYECPDYKEEFSGQEMQDMNFGSDDEEISATTYANLVSLVTGKVISAFGGYDRINTFRVVGGAIAINGTIFRSKVNKDCLGLLPLDIRRQISAGNLAELFNYRELYNMPNLRGLDFDSEGFVYNRVSPLLGFVGTIGVDNYFDAFSSLQLLKIGSRKFSRQNYKTEIGDEDIFSYQSKATKYAKMCDSNLSNLTSKSWSFTKNMFNSKNHGLIAKTFGVMFGLSASVATGAATLGAKAVRGVSHKVDRYNQKKTFTDKAKNGFSAFKGGFKDLFN